MLAVNPLKLIITLLTICAFFLAIDINNAKECRLCGSGPENFPPKGCFWDVNPNIGINLIKRETRDGGKLRYSNRDWVFSTGHIKGTDNDYISMKCVGGSKYDYLFLPSYNSTLEYWWCHGTDSCTSIIPRRFLSLYTSAGVRRHVPDPTPS